MSERVLVVGARPHSLGESVVQAVVAAGYEPVIAGISGEAVGLDLVSDPASRMKEVLAGVAPRHIVCTAGTNLPRGAGEDVAVWYGEHLWVNTIGPMRLLDAWIEVMADPDYLPEVDSSRELLHFVAVSSNSARIPRTGSAAYCASKAALSMALRVAAREAIGGDWGWIAYGYEPGLLAGTPMTKETEERFSGGPLHRMRGVHNEPGVPVDALAATIASNLRLPGAALNGCLIPFDAGEQ